MQKQTFCLTAIAAAVTAAASLAAPPAGAQFYEGKTVTVVVGYTAGGGADVFGRLLARHRTTSPAASWCRSCS